MAKKEFHFNTKAIHGGQAPDAGYGAVMPPIYQTSTFAQESPGKHKGFAYARGANPTRQALEQAMASLENGNYGLAFASGVAAIDAVLKLLKPGDEVLATKDIYGGSYRLFCQLFANYNITFKFVAMDNPAELGNLITSRTKLLWVETPTNPLMNLVDIKAVAAIAKKHNVLLAVDNTFASPYLQRPLELGAAIVMHSATKYLGGHSDVILGGLVVEDQQLAEKLYFIQNTSGAIAGPMDSYLTLRGIKTLPLRMQRHCDNAKQLAHYLRNHPKIGQVYWPGFEDHPGHAVAKAQMLDFGGMIAFTPKNNTKEVALSIVEKLNIFTLAESLGGVESLVGHPASMSHGSMPKPVREANGITDGLIRLSVGIEAYEDLIADLEQAIG